MTPVCTCENPRPEPSKYDPDNKVCRLCGYWWSPKYGSSDPDLDAPILKTPPSVSGRMR